MKSLRPFDWDIALLPLDSKMLQKPKRKRKRSPCPAHEAQNEGMIGTLKMWIFTETAQVFNLACSLPKFFVKSWVGLLRKWLYCELPAAWKGLEACHQAAPNDQHFRGTWQFFIRRLVVQKRALVTEHWACHWFHMVTVPITFYMLMIYFNLYFVSLCSELSTGPQTSTVPDAP